MKKLTILCSLFLAFACSNDDSNQDDSQIP